MAAANSSLDMITSALSESSAPAAPEAPSISPETTAEIDSIPDGAEEQSTGGIETDEVAAEPEAEPEQQAQPPDGDEERPEIENLSESRWKRVHGGYKYTRELAKVFGIVTDDKQPIDMSLMPTIEEIQASRTAYSDRLAMEHDFSSGDPQDAQQFIANWHTFSPEGMAMVAAQLPQYFSSVNPQTGQPRDMRAYVALASPIMSNVMSNMLAKARSIADPELRDYVASLYRSMNWWLTGGMDGGTFESDEQLQQRLQQQPVQQQPNETERQLQQAQARLEQINRDRAAQQWKSVQESVTREVGQDFSARMGKTLAPLKKFYPNDSLFSAVRNDFKAKIQSEMAKDSYGMRAYQIAAQSAQRGAQGGAEAMKAAWLQMVRTAMSKIGPGFVSELSKNLVAANQTKHAALAKNASKVSPASGGAPRQQSIVPEIKRAPGESMVDFQQRQIAAMLG